MLLMAEIVTGVGFRCSVVSRVLLSHLACGSQQKLFEIALEMALVHEPKCHHFFDADRCRLKSVRSERTT